MAAHDELDDEALLLAWRGGDQRAGSILVGRHYHRIARFFCARRMGDWEELTQSTFLGCVEGIGRFRGEASFSTFIFAIAHKQLLKRLRDQGRSERRARSLDVATDDPADGSSWSRGSASAIHQRLLAILRTLPVDTQVMLELHYWKNEGIRAIAARFGLPEGTVKARLHRGRQQIMAEFEGLEGAPSDFEIMRHALEQWAEGLNDAGADGEPVKLAVDATTRLRGEQPRRHEDPHPTSPIPVSLPPRRSGGARGHGL